MLPSLLLLASLIVASLARFHPGPKQRKYGSSCAPKIEARRTAYWSHMKRAEVVTPKIFIISMFDSEADIWYEKMPSILEKNVTLPGASPLYPDAHCIESGEVCQLTTGEGEINAASSITALIYSGLFNLTSTYFLVAGIAGINPHVGTTGAVTFSRYAVQLDLQYEFDARQIPSNDSSGYFPQDSVFPDEAAGIDYPDVYGIYGTEVFELNNDLKKRFVYLASLPTLNDTDAAQAYRATYGYAPANEPPSVVQCDSGTSNVYWSGSILGDAFSAYTKLLTNGSGT